MAAMPLDDPVGLRDGPGKLPGLALWAGLHRHSRTPLHEATSESIDRDSER